LFRQERNDETNISKGASRARGDCVKSSVSLFLGKWGEVPQRRINHQMQQPPATFASLPLGQSKMLYWNWGTNVNKQLL